MQINELKKGDVVIVTDNFGRGPQIEGVVDMVSENINDGYAGIDYTANGHLKWAYIDQVVRKVS